MTCTVELRCAACGSVFLAEGDPTGAEFACPVCLSSGRVAARPDPRDATAVAPRAKPAVSPGAAATPPPTRQAAHRPAAPASVEPPAPAPPAPRRPAIPEPVREVVCPRCKLHFTPRGGPTKPGPGDRPRVLLVDRPGFLLDALREALGAQYEVRTSSDVDQARGLLARGDVDLMILDPEIGPDGQTLLPGPLRKSFPVLIYTAADEAQLYGERWEELHSLGADDIVVKGMNAAEQLSRKVAALLGLTLDDSDEP